MTVVPSTVVEKILHDDGDPEGRVVGATNPRRRLDVQIGIEAGPPDEVDRTTVQLEGPAQDAMRAPESLELADQHEVVGGAIVQNEEVARQLRVRVDGAQPASPGDRQIHVDPQVVEERIGEPREKRLRNQRSGIHYEAVGEEERVS